MNNLAHGYENTIFPDIASHQDEDGWRFYGNKLSVTTVISNAVANKKLESWYKKTSEKKIYTTVNAAADFGTNAHALLESLILHQEPVVADNIMHLIEPMKAFIKEHDIKPIATEACLTSERYGVAGRCDFYGSFDGQLVVADWKTSNHYSVTFGWQLCMYRRMLMDITGDKEVGALVVKIDKKTGLPTFFKYEHYQFCEDRFFAALEVFKGLYFSKLSKAEWPWLKLNSMRGEVL